MNKTLNELFAKKAFYNKENKLLFALILFLFNFAVVNSWSWFCHTILYSSDI
jgi:hypothetical protein